MKRHHIFGMIASLALGCATTQDAGPVANDGKADVVAPAASGASTFYDCRANTQRDLWQRFEVEVSASQLRLVDMSPLPMSPDTAQRLTGPVVSGEFAMYEGLNELASAYPDEIKLQAAVSPEVLAGQVQGELRLVLSGDRNRTDGYACKKTREFVAAPSDQPEFTCALLTCRETDEGETCLPQVKLSGSVMQELWVDRPENGPERLREEQLGAASAWVHDALRFTGEWPNRTLELTYRDGITYVGTYNVCNGARCKLVDIACNDAALAP